MPPPVVALLVGAAMWLASAGPSLPWPLLARMTGAIAIALLGGAIAVAGDLAFKRAKTTINPLHPENTTSLVTSGVYRITRNPMYLGLLLVVLAWAVYLLSAWAFLGPVAFALYIRRFQIAPEERILGARFGEAYSSYTSEVRRWL